MCAQSRWFQPSLLEKPEVRKALKSVDDRATGIVDEWIRIVEIPAPSAENGKGTRGLHSRGDGESLA